jgi:hypothetical protein
MSLKPIQQSRRSSNIFINYRRDDSAGHAGRLFDRLSSRFPNRVFMDIDTIEPGTDFVESIEQAVGCCEVLIVMIGRKWLTLTDATGGRRVDNPHDFVRLEIGAALQRNVRIIPVLVDDAVVPRPEDLPPELARLTRRNAIELSDSRWAFDVDRLIQVIEKVLQDRAPSALLPALKAPCEPAPAPPGGKRMRSRTWLVPTALVLLAALGWIGWGQWNLSRQLNLLDAEKADVSTTDSTKPSEPQPESPVMPPAVTPAKLTSTPRPVDSPRYTTTPQPKAREKKSRLGSKLKNIWGRVKTGAGKKNDGKKGGSERQGG